VKNKILWIAIIYFAIPQMVDFLIKSHSTNNWFWVSKKSFDESQIWWMIHPTNRDYVNLHCTSVSGLPPPIFPLTFSVIFCILPPIIHISLHFPHFYSSLLHVYAHAPSTPSRSMHTLSGFAPFHPLVLRTDDRVCHIEIYLSNRLVKFFVSWTVAPNP